MPSDSEFARVRRSLEASRRAGAPFERAWTRALATVPSMRVAGRTWQPQEVLEREAAVAMLAQQVDVWQDAYERRAHMVESVDALGRVVRRDLLAQSPTILAEQPPAETDPAPMRERAGTRSQLRAPALLA